MRELLDNLLKINTKPLLFELGWSLTSSTARPCSLGEAKFWDDPHISKSMLEAHLNPNHDAASRRPETIDKTVKHLFESKVLKPGMKVLDLGCGPGLYAERLCQGLVAGKACCSPMHPTGVEVVGIDMKRQFKFNSCKCKPAISYIFARR